MAKLDWRKAAKRNPDPARLRSENIPVQMSDRDTATFKQKSKKKHQASKVKVPRKALSDILPDKRVGKSRSLRDRIRVVRTSGKPDANAFIQETAIQALRHAETTGDFGYVASLVAALPSGVRQARLADWISKFSPVRFERDKKGGVKASLRKDGATFTNRFDYVGARRTPFK